MSMDEEDAQQERLNSIAEELLGDDIVLSDAELDPECRAEKGEQFGYEK